MSLVRSTRALLRVPRLSFQVFGSGSLTRHTIVALPRAAIRGHADVSKMHHHVVQIGDPVLRQPCVAVDPQDIQSPAIQSVIKNLKDSLDKFEMSGISACQLGVPLQIFAIQVTQPMVTLQSPKNIKEQEIHVEPLRVCINPKVRVVNTKVKSAKEYCLSVEGWTALVPRYSEVAVTYLDEKGMTKNWTATGFTARMIQHEMDHLNGVMFTDKMKNESFETLYWLTLNGTFGKYKLGFGEASERNRSRLAGFANKIGFGGLVKLFGYSK